MSPAKDPVVKLCLAAGKIQGDESWLRSHFERHGWILLGPEQIRPELLALQDAGYENSVAAVVAKLLLREPRRPKRKEHGIDAAV